MTEKAEIGIGDVELDLDGEKIVLRPTLEACLALSRAGNGIHGPGALSERLTRYDFDAFSMVIRAGAGIPPSVKGVDEKIFRAGMINLVRPLSRYLAIVANGGQPQPKDDEGDGQAPGPLSGAAAAKES